MRCYECGGQVRIKEEATWYPTDGPCGFAIVQTGRSFSVQCQRSRNNPGKFKCPVWLGSGHTMDEALEDFYRKESAVKARRSAGL